MLIDQAPPDYVPYCHNRIISGPGSRRRHLLANPRLARAYGLAPAEAGAPLPDNVDTRTYHLGKEPTPGRGYDDRLTMRLGPSRSKLMEEIALWTQFGGRRGGLPHVRAGNRIWVCEADARAFMSARRTTA